MNPVALSLHGNRGRARPIFWCCSMPETETETEVAPIPAAAPKGDAAAVPVAASESQQYSFDDMRLKVGDQLQLEPPQSVTNKRYVVRLLGYLDGRSLMVTSPVLAANQHPLIEGDRLVVRIFSGQSAFGFNSFVERLIRSPFDYLHLTFPKVIEGLIIRKSPRVKTWLAVQVRSAGTDVEATFVNLSATGMLLHSEAAVGEVGGTLSLKFSLQLFGTTASLTLNARIRTSTALSADAASPQHQHGLEFVDVLPNDMLVLQAFVHQTLVENPHSIV